MSHGNFRLWSTCLGCGEYCLRSCDTETAAVVKEEIEAKDRSRTNLEIGAARFSCFSFPSSYLSSPRLVLHVGLPYSQRFLFLLCSSDVCNIRSHWVARREGRSNGTVISSLGFASTNIVTQPPNRKRRTDIILPGNHCSDPRRTGRSPR